MRERAFIIGGAVLMVAAIAGGIFVFTRDGDDGVLAGEIVLATAINPDTGEPSDGVDSFPFNRRGDLATIPVDDVDAGTVFRFRWTKGGADEVVDEHTAPVDIEDGWVFGSLSLRGGLPPGDDYAVEVLIGDDSIATRAFSVTE